MSLTFADIVDRLQKYDEITILELLDISAEDLLKAFPEKIEERYEILEELLSDNEEIETT